MQSFCRYYVTVLFNSYFFVILSCSEKITSIYIPGCNPEVLMTAVSELSIMFFFTVIPGSLTNSITA